MTCQEAMDLLATRGDGPADATTGWRFKLHLWCCRNCRNYLSTYLSTERLTRAARPTAREDNPAVPEELVAEILSAARRPG